MTPNDSEYRVYRAMVLVFMSLYCAAIPTAVGLLIAWLGNRPLYEGVLLGLFFGTAAVAFMMSVPEVREDFEEGNFEEYQQNLTERKKPEDKPEDGYYGW